MSADKLRPGITKDYNQDLLDTHRVETELFLKQSSSFSLTARKAILKAYDKSVDKDNILKYYTHPVRKFLNHLVHGTLQELETHTSATILPKVNPNSIIKEFDLTELETNQPED